MTIKGTAGDRNQGTVPRKDADLALLLGLLALIVLVLAIAAVVKYVFFR